MSDKAHKDQEQKVAEAEVDEFKKDLGPFVVAAESTRMPMVFTDAGKPDNPIIFANDAFLKLTGYDRPEVLAQSFNFLLDAGCNEEASRLIKAAFDKHCEQDLEINFSRKDGSEFWADLFINSVEDEKGQVVQHFVSLVDTTRFKLAQKNAAMLIDELNHRVKNTLATVQSIVIQAVRNSDDPQIVRESIETRISALSRSHDLLGREKWDGAALRDGGPRGACAVQRNRRRRRTLHDRGRECPAIAQGDPGAGHCIQRTGDQRGQIWRILE